MCTLSLNIFNCFCPLSSSFLLPKHFPQPSLFLFFLSSISFLPSFLHSFIHSFHSHDEFIDCGRACTNSCIQLSVLYGLHLQSRTFKQGYSLKRSGMFQIIGKHLYGWQAVTSVFIKPLKRTHELLGACDSSVNVTQFSITQEDYPKDGFMVLLGDFLDCIN